VFAAHLSPAGVPQLLGVHTSAIFQTGQSQLRNLSLVGEECNSAAEAAAAAAATTTASSEEECLEEEAAEAVNGSKGASSRRSIKRPREAASASAATATASVSSSPGKGVVTGSTTPEETPTTRLQLKLADEVQHKSALSICVVADSVLQQHVQWVAAALAAEAAAAVVGEAVSSAAAADMDVGIPRPQQEQRQKQSSPHFFQHSGDVQSLYD